MMGIQYSVLESNPFAVLTAIVAPAILTNASSVLALGTGNRLGRVVDRTRIVAKDLASYEPSSSEHRAWTEQLRALQVRAQMLVRALRLFYAALGLFAASAFVSLIGSIAAYYGQRIVFQVAAALAILIGGAAVAGLAFGCALMIRETRLAVQLLEDEAGRQISQAP
ncbi:MAG: DUF2721 domain-containing protein [Acidobacteria bacterium]|nr:DUF2721 domain-containing protein [Acidobacteriota bacterium]